MPRPASGSSARVSGRPSRSFSQLTRHHARTILALVVMAGATAACGEEPTAVEDIPTIRAKGIDGNRVTPETLSVAVGKSVTANCQPLDSRGRSLRRTCYWNTRDSAIATVTGGGTRVGTITGRGAGVTWIVASAERNRDSVRVTVGGQGGSEPPPSDSTSPPPVDSTPLPPDGGKRVGWYVAPNGSSSSTGAIERPWSIQYAITGAGRKIQPGDTVWFRGGTYRGDFEITVDGSPAAQVTFRAYPGERAIIDGAGSSASASTWDVKGDYITTWGLEVTNSTSGRTSSGSSDLMPNGVVNYGRGNRYVNLVIHDTGNGFFTDPNASQDVEISGSIVYNQGWEGSDRSHGPGLYLKSHTGPVTARHNVIFNNLRNGIQAYTSSSYQSITNIHLIQNVSFENGGPAEDGPVRQIELGGDRPVRQGEVRGNLTYLSGGEGIGIKVGYSGQTGTDVVVADNLIVGGDRAFELYPFSTATVRNNRFVGTQRMVGLYATSRSGISWSGNKYARDAGASAWYFSSSRSFSAWRSATGLGSSDQIIPTPTGQEVFVWPDTWERGRAIVTVYNWSGGGTATATVPTLPAGQRYTVHHVYNLWGPPVAEGTYSGSISIPLGTVSAPRFLGSGSARSVPSTGRAFGVFVVRPR